MDSPINNFLEPDTFFQSFFVHGNGPGNSFSTLRASNFPIVKISQKRYGIGICVKNFLFESNIKWKECVREMSFVRNVGREKYIGQKKEESYSKTVSYIFFKKSSIIFHVSPQGEVLARRGRHYERKGRCCVFPVVGTSSTPVVKNFYRMYFSKKNCLRSKKTWWIDTFFLSVNFTARGPFRYSRKYLR